MQTTNQVQLGPVSGDALAKLRRDSLRRKRKDQNTVPPSNRFPAHTTEPHRDLWGQLRRFEQMKAAR